MTTFGHPLGHDRLTLLVTHQLRVPALCIQVRPLTLQQVDPPPDPVGPLTELWNFVLQNGALWGVRAVGVSGRASLQWLQIDPKRALGYPLTSNLPGHRDTVYLTVVDAQRNAVSFINSTQESPSLAT